MQRLRQVDWPAVRAQSLTLFRQLIRTKEPLDDFDDSPSSHRGRRRLTRCLSTMDLVSLGVGSCVGTGMYLVTGLVAHQIAGPGVMFSFIIAAFASILSGASYAEFGVRVPHTTGSAYMYAYVTVGEFVAFIIGWNMVLEYVIGTSACARALSACFDSITGGAIHRWSAENLGTVFGEPPDVLAFVITLAMTAVLMAGVRKSLAFNHGLNIVTAATLMFVVAAGLFYVDTDNWTAVGDDGRSGFLPHGWKGVFTGAATCFYAFIGFDVIATTGEEAHNPKRAIPLAIVLSMLLLLLAYVATSIVFTLVFTGAATCFYAFIGFDVIATTGEEAHNPKRAIPLAIVLSMLLVLAVYIIISIVLTLVVPYGSVDPDAGLVAMFGYVNAPTCQLMVALGSVAGLTASMLGSMFPMPRVVYAMAKDGLIHRQLSRIWEATGAPGCATLVGGLAASFVALLVRLQVLVEMMSIGTLLAYTLVSICVLILRYQPHMSNLIELLPQRLRGSVANLGAGGASQSCETSFGGFEDAGTGRVLSDSQQRIMIRRFTRCSPDSDESIPCDDEGYGPDDQFLVSEIENTYYGSVHAGGSGGGSRMRQTITAIRRRLYGLSYLCPGIFPWVEAGPATKNSGWYVTRAVGVLFVLMLLLDLLAAFGSPGSSDATATLMVLLAIAMFVVLLAISRKPQSRNPNLFMCPALPYAPALGITINVYLTLNLSYLTLVRFTAWMVIGLIVYFRYGIKNSSLAQPGMDEPTPPPHAPPPPPPGRGAVRHVVAARPPPPEVHPPHSRNIFQGDIADDGLQDPFAAWEEAEHAFRNTPFTGLEQRYDPRTDRSSSHTTSATAASSTSGPACASTSGTRHTPTVGIHNPSTSGLHNPSTSGLHNPSTSGLHNPSTSGLRNPSPSGISNASMSNLRNNFTLGSRITSAPRNAPAPPPRADSPLFPAAAAPPTPRAGFPALPPRNAPAAAPRIAPWPRVAAPTAAVTSAPRAGAAAAPTPTVAASRPPWADPTYSARDGQ